MARAARALTLVLAAGLLLLGSSSTVRTDAAGPWVESRFQTGCDPGPFQPPPSPEHLQTQYPPLGADLLPATVSVDLDVGAAGTGPPILGTGFNFEHALWSCPEFRGLLRSQILDPFMPAIARVDTGLLPAAPPELPAQDLDPSVYESVLSSPQFADSWRFFQRLNRSGVKIVLGVWGGPGQFTDDGTRLGTLLPSHYNDYADYVFTVVNFIVRQGISDRKSTRLN